MESAHRDVRWNRVGRVGRSICAGVFVAVAEVVGIVGGRGVLLGIGCWFVMDFLIIGALHVFGGIGVWIY